MAITTELVIARHGEAVCNTAGIVGGERGCTGLTARGREQVAHLAKRLSVEHADRPFDVLYTTSRRRVQETTQIITETLNLPATVVRGLRGLDHGEADGQPWREVKTAFGGRPQHAPKGPFAPGAESWTAYLERSTTALKAIIDSHEGHRVLIAAHGETIQAAHALLLGLPPDTYRHADFVTNHACLTRWQRHVNRLGQVVWMLDTHNDTSHLTDAS